tara:strand:- start:3630 stop:4544 length:915 start_codon:yes stop_codon:yes gene_type:complete
MKVLVTGGDGFIGKHLVESLTTLGCDVVITSRRRSTQSREVPCISYRQVNYNDIAQLTSLFTNEQPDYVIHLASDKDRSSLSSIKSSKLLDEVINGTNVIYASASLPDLKRFIYIGTSDQYDFSVENNGFPGCYTPANSYGFVKSMLSLLLTSLHRDSGFPVVQLVPTIVYGPGQGAEMFLPSLLQALIRGEEIEMTKGEQYRDFIYVSDLATAIIAALFTVTDECLGKTYSVCSGNPKQLIDVVRLAVKESKSDMKQILVGKRPYRSGESMEYFSNYDAFAKDANWAPVVSLEEGIQHILGLE